MRHHKKTIRKLGLRRMIFDKGSKSGEAKVKQRWFTEGYKRPGSQNRRKRV